MRLLLLTCALCLSWLCQAVTVGADRFDHYLPLLEGKRVALVVNPTSQTRDGHLLDALLARGIHVTAIMSPEHGFRGTASAGQKVEDGTDPATGLPVYSLYGSTKKPTAGMLAQTDVLVFDIQDVGARFYTYLSTLHYVMEAAAQAGKALVVLDRPNPNGAYVAGPVLDPAFRSFVGMHPIPVLHGMTLGELASMIRGEGWIDKAGALSLTVIPVADYKRTQPYSLPVAPSPNLPGDDAIRLYPSLCLFEGTAVSVGRGTPYPFTLIGHDKVVLGNNAIAVVPNAGAVSPKLDGTVLHARRLQSSSIHGFDISLLVSAYQQFTGAGEPFFTHPAFFDKLAGTDTLRQAIERGESAAAITARWQSDLAAFIERRAPYLLYPEDTAQNGH
ncbi:exo-beta-N-acetylmuramidase NamZ family protein [Alteromonas sp. CYL-A6]|uniref:exo-beta-N-acetylmuramidase NamZ family protein n=1 Tax=Alteromonas nitratireducens TaxID=3390813 RepID=UPI0034BDC25F